MLTYDSTGELPSNWIVDEKHAPLTQAAIFPIHGAFYKKGLAIRARLIEGGNIVPLDFITDYGFGPLYGSRSWNAALVAYSYIVLYRPIEYSEIYIDYHGVGGEVDTTLAVEISNKGTFDRMDPSIWLTFYGESMVRRTQDIDPAFKDKDILEVVSDKLELIRLQLGTPNLFITEAIQDFNILRGEIEAEKATLTNLIATIQFQLDNGTLITNIPIVHQIDMKTEELVVVGDEITLTETPKNGIDSICNFTLVSQYDSGDNSTTFCTIEKVTPDPTNRVFRVKSDILNEFDSKTIKLQYMYVV